mmetsp:Transcript_1251/g.4930  ORF Transcript_1251/g.4930 Transcript_1251/m.4930 type:complete len:233 (-) Transcript_1251:729-1427(-)
MHRGALPLQRGHREPQLHRRSTGAGGRDTVLRGQGSPGSADPLRSAGARPPWRESQRGGAGNRGHDVPRAGRPREGRRRQVLQGRRKRPPPGEGGHPRGSGPRHRRRSAADVDDGVDPLRGRWQDAHDVHGRGPRRAPLGQPVTRCPPDPPDGDCSVCASVAAAPFKAPSNIPCIAPVAASPLAAVDGHAPQRRQRRSCESPAPHAPAGRQAHQLRSLALRHDHAPQPLLVA